MLVLYNEKEEIEDVHELMVDYFLLLILML